MKIFRWFYFYNKIQEKVKIASNLNIIYYFSRDKDGDTEDCIPSPKIISTQTLSIVEEDGSLGSEDQSAVAEITQSQELLDPLEDEYHIRSNDGIFFLF